MEDIWYNPSSLLGDGNDAIGINIQQFNFIALPLQLLQGVQDGVVLNGRGKMSALRNRLIAGLSQIPDAVLNGDPENRLPGNVNFSFEGIEGESLVLLLTPSHRRPKYPFHCYTA